MSETHVYKKVKESLTTNDMITPYLLSNYIEMIADENNLTNFISNINILKNIRNINGSYSFPKEELGINYFSYILNTNSINSNDNLKLYETCFHELMHSCQKSILADSYFFRNYTSYYCNLADCIMLMNVDYDCFMKYYDNLILEYQAIMVSDFKLLELLQKFNLESSIIDTNKLIAEQIVKYYKDEIPIKKSLRLIEEYAGIRRPYIDLDRANEYIKIMFGYPIEDKTMYVVDNIANDKVKTLDIVKHLGG